MDATTAQRLIASPSRRSAPRVEDKLSVLYLDMVRVERDDFGFHALSQSDGETVTRDLPVASLGVLLLGPGTSITQPALSGILRHGCTVLLIGATGTRFYGAVPGSGVSSKWLEVQARAWADPDSRLLVAKRMYSARFRVPVEELGGCSLAELRGMGGRG